MLDGKDAGEVDIELLKVTHLRKMGRYTTEFMWLGSPLKGRKKRRHYQSFSRNGVIVSVHDFVFVLAEEDKRLVAYLEDMYEDSKGNKMVVVRWFHKVDEVGMVLPLNFNDREIFFSLCHQHLSIECIDGLATVLSPVHFEKFLKEAKQTQLEPFVCHKQFENDDVKPFDITQVEGYWKQEILRYMHTVTPSKVPVSSQQSVDELKAEEVAHASDIRPKKRQRSLKDDDMHVEAIERRVSLGAACGEAGYISENGTDCKSKSEAFSLGRRGSAVILPCPEVKQILPQYLAVGSQVEVLSQDSGIRGCWFRALIIKKHKDKVKVQYQDIQDAADEANKLEEWILASKIAASDQLGLRLSDRPSIRPCIKSNKGRVSWSVGVGSVVDVWRHDGWWEGIVLQKECDDRLHVYFPGENQVLIAGRGEVRHSQEWLGREWAYIKDRPDLVASISSNLETKKTVGNSFDGMSGLSEIIDSRELKKHETSALSSDNDKDEKVNEVDKVPDLLKDDLFVQLKWKSSRKRRRGNGSSAQKLHFGSDGKSTSGLMGSKSCERYLIPSSLVVDHENCKYLGDSLFSSSVAPSLTSLVM
ncbi:putative BAH domain, Agenet-like domain, Agenet domain, plant type [Rosa chinensis]|uniref:Putative BAH domain, Agenet-like domain, Agenet domain, plant type n=3 Tax=Rosa chinensis TaxID=74649 RepID=A0A2P6R1Y8_ROSCH|nr:uncharacterized protein LOC112195935 isoform X2 [Rosa chinensis]PRQ40389.1 putative BAH domain, Agenet-like domain, Agenet domain, plant type [Rosa chinensis]